MNYEGVVTGNLQGRTSCYKSCHFDRAAMGLRAGAKEKSYTTCKTILYIRRQLV